MVFGLVGKTNHRTFGVADGRVLKACLEPSGSEAGLGWGGGGVSGGLGSRSGILGTGHSP